MKDEWLIPAIVALLAPCVTFVCRGRAIAWWHFPLWLSSLGSIVVLCVTFEPNLALTFLLSLLVLICLLLRYSIFNSYFCVSRLIKSSDNNFVKILIAKVLGFYALHILLTIINRSVLDFFNFGHAVQSKEILDMFHNYFILGDSLLMQIWFTLALIILIGVIIPILEELTFRGFFQSWLRVRFVPWVVMFIVSFVFAILHGIDQFLPKFFFGLFASNLTYRYGCISPAIGLHIITNTSAILTAALLTMTGIDEDFNQRNTERIAQVNKDAELAKLTTNHDYQLDVEKQVRIRKAYEPKLRELMVVWGISQNDQDNVLDIFDKAELSYDKLLIENMKLTPQKIGNRRNFWNVRAFEEYKKSQYKSNRSQLRESLQTILGTEERVRQFEKIAYAARSKVN